MTLKIGIDVKYTLGYKTIKSDCDIYFSNLNYVAKFPNLSGAGCHGNRIKNLMLCAMYTYIIYPSMINMQLFVFELRLLQCVANKRPFIATMATRLK